MATTSQAVKTDSKNLLSVSTSPHVHKGVTTPRVMWEVIVFLIPAIFAAIFYFGLPGLALIIACSVGAVVTEFLIQKFLFRIPPTLHDGSALLTGILLALCLPAGMHWVLGFIGGVVAIAIAKQVYGGLGQNVFNPAHVARAVLLASWPVAMTTWLVPNHAGVYAANVIKNAKAAGITAITHATPLSLYAVKMGKFGQKAADDFTGAIPTYWDLLVGNVGGSLGETCALALIFGGIALAIRGHIKIELPLIYIATVGILMQLVGWDPLYQILAGGLMIGAFFMATDMVTCPISRRGQLIFGFGCGLLTFLIRRYGGYPEGVCYSILIMNAFVPLIDRYTLPRKFGSVQEAK